VSGGLSASARGVCSRARGLGPPSDMGSLVRVYDECPARVISASGGIPAAALVIDECRRSRRGPDVALNPGPDERQPHDLRRTLPPGRTASVHSAPAMCSNGVPIAVSPVRRPDAH
jgi:hypothetical protein